MARRGKAKRSVTLQNTTEENMVRSLDALSEFQEFQAEILPKLRKMLKTGASAEDINKFAASAAAARVVTIAVSEQDSGKALAAAKDILDRSYGKATEKKEITHRLKDVSDEELDALLLSEYDDLSDMEGSSDQD